MPKLTKRAYRYGLAEDLLTDWPTLIIEWLRFKKIFIRLFPDLLANTKFVKRGGGLMQPSRNQYVNGT